MELYNKVSWSSRSRGPGPQHSEKLHFLEYTFQFAIKSDFLKVRYAHLQLLVNIKKIV